MPANKKRQRWNTPNTTAVEHDEDKQLAKAIELSKAEARAEGAYSESLEKAIVLSKQDAAEVEALSLAMQASLESEQERIIALGLGVQATANLAKASLGQGKTEPSNTTSTTYQNYLQNRAIPSVQTFKVVRGSDVRRLRVQWSSVVLDAEFLASLRIAVENGFGLLPETEYNLKYEDDDGDLCTLVEGTILDFRELSRHSPKKLILEIAAESSNHGGRSKDDDLSVENGLSIATSLASPRAESIEDDYEAAWDIVELDS
jgi:hypothetical protein